MAAVQINFNTKHLTKGDALPPYTGKPRVYNMRFCPYAHRTILALNAKKVDYEVVNINLFDKPEWLTSKNIFGKVPFVEVKQGETISESLVTVEYIDDIYPQRPLLPKDPLKKAHDKIIVESIGPFEYITDMLKDPVISQYSVPKDIYLRVYEGYRTGTQPEYDILFRK